MYLFKRRGYYHIEYLDESENRIRRISTGCKLKQDALSFLSGFKQRLAARPQSNFKTLSAFTDEYVGYLAKTHSVKYTRDAKAAFRKLCEFAGDIPLQDLSPITFETFFTASFKRAQFETARNYRTLKAAFNRAVERNYLPDNPLRKIKLPKIPKSIPVFIMEIELAQIIAETKNETLKDIFITGFHTGMRLSEILNLRWGEVNLSDKRIKVANTEAFTTKSKQDRIIPINSTLSAILEKRKPKVLSIDGNNLVLGKSTKVPFNVNYVSRKFKGAVRLAGLGEDIHFHSLRHSFASNLIKRGVPIVAVKELLGHSDISTTMIYSHVRREDLVNAVKMLEGGV